MQLLGTVFILYVLELNRGKLTAPQFTMELSQKEEH